MFVDYPPSLDQRLSRSDTFRFSCHKGLSCFNSCCRNKHLPLTPYDVLRLKTALGLDSDEFLSRHTLYNIDPRSGFPIISIRMKNNPERSCPFVSPEGCTVYEDRPTACRLFPLARAVALGMEGDERREFFTLLDIPGCLGLREPAVMSVEQWMHDQGLEAYIAMNDPMVDFVLRAKNALGRPLDEASLRRVIVSCYNIDVFRDFVFSTNFLDAFEIEEKMCRRARDDDMALLELGLVYLKRGLAS